MLPTEAETPWGLGAPLGRDARGTCGTCGTGGGATAESLTAGREVTDEGKEPVAPTAWATGPRPLVRSTAPLAWVDA
ncbi:MAG: hypothetical protein NVS3B20_24370 [Polyangiales bacterium]